MKILSVLTAITLLFVQQAGADSRYNRDNDNSIDQHPELAWQPQQQNRNQVNLLKGVPILEKCDANGRTFAKYGCNLLSSKKPNTYIKEVSLRGGISSPLVEQAAGVMFSIHW